MGLDIDGSWPRISFGRYNNVSIGEGEHATNKRLGNRILSLKANNGIKFESDGTSIFHYTPTKGSLASERFYFGKAVSGPQFITTSDARLKTDIEELDNVGAQIRNLVPVSYVLLSDVAASGDTETSEGENDASTSRHQYGFLPTTAATPSSPYRPPSRNRPRPSARSPVSRTVSRTTELSSPVSRRTAPIPSTHRR